MKTVLVALVVAITLGLLAAHSFKAFFSGTILTLPPTASSSDIAGSGGAPRKNPVPGSTSSNPNGFIGPSGPPHIKGPSGPPPGG